MSQTPQQLEAARKSLAWAKDTNNVATAGGGAALLAILFSPQLPRVAAVSLLVLYIVLMLVFNFSLAAAEVAMGATPPIGRQGRRYEVFGEAAVGIAFSVVTIGATKWPLERGTHDWYEVAVIVAVIGGVGLFNRRVVERRDRELTAKESV